MMKDNDFIVTHSFTGEPEMSNTKPPFVIWCMVISCKVLGFNELSIRLPNAIAAVVLCFLLFFILTKITKQALAGFLAVLALISSSGYCCWHVIRSGEYDSMLITFIFIYCIAFFLLTEIENIRHRTLLWIVFTVGVIIAILTKGIAAMMIIPTLPIYVCLRHKFLWYLHSKETYISIFFILLFGLGYYFLREHFNPGYIDAVWANELGGRYMETNDAHREDSYFYVALIANKYFTCWIPFVLIALASAVLSSINNMEKRIVLFCALATSILVIVLSISATKLYWYCTPALPFLAAMAGIGCNTVIRLLFGNNLKALSPIKKLYIGLFIVLITAPAYGKVILDNLNVTEPPWDAGALSVAHYINHKLEAKENINGYKIVKEDYTYMSLLCYTKKLSALGQQVEILLPSTLHIGDKVILHYLQDKSAVEKRFTHQVIEQNPTVEIWLLTDSMGVH